MLYCKCSWIYRSLPCRMWFEDAVACKNMPMLKMSVWIESGKSQPIQMTHSHFSCSFWLIAWCPFHGVCWFDCPVINKCAQRSATSKKTVNILMRILNLWVRESGFSFLTFTLALKEFWRTFKVRNACDIERSVRNYTVGEVTHMPKDTLVVKTQS